MVPQATLQLLEQQKRLHAATQALALRQWRRIPERGDWSTAWLRLVPTVVAAVGVAQVRAAALGAASVPAALLEQGLEAEPLTVNQRAFAGWMEPEVSPWQASLGEALLTAPLVRARQMGALESGAWMLTSLVQQAVAQAARGATQAGIAGRNRVDAVFYEPGGCCQRCAVLVGKKMPFGADFQRHPRCDGQIVAVASGKPSPVKEFGPDDITDLSRWQKQALADGADLNKVINSQAARGGRELRSPLYDNGLKTYAGTGHKQRGDRLTPKGIYRIAGSDRGKAQALLRQYGYIT